MGQQVPVLFIFFESRDFFIERNQIKKDTYQDGDDYRHYYPEFSVGSEYCFSTVAYLLRCYRSRKQHEQQNGEKTFHFIHGMILS
jgi:hypothetical protein